MEHRKKELDTFNELGDTNKDEFDAYGSEWDRFSFSFFFFF